MLLCVVDVPAAHAAIKQALSDGILSIQELDEHVSRILHAKQWAFAHAQKQYSLEDIETPDTHKLLQKLYNAALTVVPAQTSVRTLRKNDRCAIVYITNNATEPFVNELKEHQSIDIFKVSPNALQTEQTEVLENLKAYDCIIVSIHSLTRFAREKFGITESMQTFIDRICSDYRDKTIGIILGNAYSLEYFKHFHHCLVAYDNSSYAQKAAAQTLLGKIKPSGTLPVTI
jgi:beta-glucosidase-like glycosyl hydrolase